MAKIAFSFRIEESTYEKIKAKADKEMRSFNAQCEYMLTQMLEREEVEQLAARSLLCDEGENF